MPNRLRYMGGLDGLRAIAVVAVVLFHAELYWAPSRFSGGFLGVDVFFVLSGFLITTLLAAEWRERNGLDVVGFWLRRARRLLPAVFLVLAALLVFTVVALRDEVTSLRGDVAAAMGYGTNWYLIFQNEAYFDAWGRPSLLRHLWSLAIEEQFYLLWPLLFVAGMYLLGTRGLFVALLAGAAASSLLMALIYEPGSDPSRVYYGTDTRATGLLLGSALALVWTPARAQAAMGWRASVAFDMAGIVGLAVLFGFFLLLDDASSFLYRGGFAATAIATAAVVAAVARPDSRLGGLMGHQPLRWIGQRSYAIYLWHWPVFVLTRPGLEVPFDGIPLLALRLVIVGLLAEVSYRLVEDPIRKGALGRAWGALQERSAGLSVRATTAAGTGVVLVLCTALAIAVLHVPPPEQPSFAVERTGLDLLSIPSERSHVANDVTEPALPLRPLFTTAYGVEGGTPQPLPANPGPRDCDTTPGTPYLTASDQERFASRCIGRDVAKARPAPTAALPPTAPPTDPPAAQPSDAPAVEWRVTAIGDSVMLGAETELQQAISSLDLHAAVSLQVSDGIELLRALRDTDALGSMVVVHLGNNGTFSSAQLDEMMEVLSGVESVVFVSLRVPRPWEEGNNAMLAENVDRFANAALIDWHGVSDRESGYFWEDGLHLRPAGAEVYAGLIGGYAATTALLAGADAQH